MKRRDDEKLEFWFPRRTPFRVRFGWGGCGVVRGVEGLKFEEIDKNDVVVVVIFPRFSCMEGKIVPVLQINGHV